MSLENIAGYENEKKDLLSLRKMLHEADRYREMGIRMPRGIILFGRPGVGKTVLARSVADEGIALVELRAADCCSDNTEEAVRAAFEKARACAPSVLLLDELDKVAGTSDNFFMEGNDDVKKILLQELDRLNEADTVLVVATSNDIESLGDALMRPGRFDRSIEVREPDEKTRYKILNCYLSRLTIRKNLDVKYLARITGGYTGAMLECLVNESAIHAINAGKKSISIADVKTMMNRMAFAGYELDPNEDRSVLKKIAVHEAGHALVAMFLCPDQLQSATIKPQGDSGGHVDMLGDENKVPDISELERDITVLIAGRVAERVALTSIGAGAEDDIGRASFRLMRMIACQGAYGYKYLVCSPIHPRFADIAPDSLKKELCRLFDSKMCGFDAQAESIITEHRDIFDRIVEALMERKILSREELFALKGGSSAGAA